MRTNDVILSASDFKTIISSMHKTAFESGSKIEDCNTFELFTNIDQASPTVYFVIDFFSQGYVHVSENVKNVLGISTQELLNGGIETGLDLFAPQHRAILVNNILPTFLKHIFAIEDKEKLKNIQISYQTLNQTVSKEYHWFLHQIKIIDFTETGAPRLGLKTITNINSFKLDSSIHFEITESSSEGTEIILKEEFKPYKEGLDISGSEKKVLALMANGFISKEIAEQLNLSPHTVNNHRKNMLKKNAINSSNELIKKALAHRIIN